MELLSAIATASTDAHTDVAPFTPQSHGVSPGCSRAASFIPSGNAIPMNRPGTPSMIAEAVTLNGVSAVLHRVARRRRHPAKKQQHPQQHAHPPHTRLPGLIAGDAIGQIA